jgi:ADP-ribosyl-[dinitrogen reductase] hydrolase
LGDDADTTGAIYGQLAGAYYGLDGIPERWRRVMALGDQILTLAEGLLSLAQRAAGEDDVAATSAPGV